MKKLIITLTMAIIVIASFGQESPLIWDVSDGDSMLVKFYYKNMIEDDNRVQVHYLTEKFTKDTVFIKVERNRGYLSMNDSIGEPKKMVGDIVESLNPPAAKEIKKTLMIGVIKKKRRGR
jgi:hypothetical protein